MYLYLIVRIRSIFIPSKDCHMEHCLNYYVLYAITTWGLISKLKQLQLCWSVLCKSFVPCKSDHVMIK
uniref:Uncharacterized protein n=1 Tax=Setaria italica TaxID=4555 RepID=K3XR69_SETIT